MHHDGTQHHEADDRPNDIDSVLVGRVLRRMRQRNRATGLHPRAGLNGQEQRTHTHGTEVAREERFLVVADIGDPAVEGEDGGDTAQEEDEGEGREQFPRAELMREALPGDDGAKVDEHGGVEEQVEHVGELDLLRLGGEPAVPGEGGAGAEADEKVVRSQRTADADAEDGQEEVEDEEGEVLDVAVLLAHLEEVVGGSADDDADQGADQALPEDHVEEEIFDRFACGGFGDGEETGVEERVADPVVAAGFGGEEMAESFGDSLRESCFTQHAGG